MSDESLINKYRPVSFEEVLGHEAVVASIEKVVEKNSSHAFLFTGNPGIGKTTLARITAKALGIKPSNIQEVDGASCTGIDDMRVVMEQLQYLPLMGGKKAIIIDEVQNLSKQAVTSLLKSVEEPPDWVYWFFCTTDAKKIPEAISSRCAVYTLQPIKTDDILDLLGYVNEEEGYKLTEDIVKLCAQEAKGSVRQGLSNLSKCSSVKTKEEAEELLRSVSEEEGSAFQLAQALAKNASWGELMRIVAGFKDVNPESVRRVVCAYMAKVALGAKTDTAAVNAIKVLDAFSHSLYDEVGTASIILACGRVCFS